MESESESHQRKTRSCDRVVLDGYTRRFKQVTQLHTNPLTNCLSASLTVSGRRAGAGDARPAKRHQIFPASDPLQDADFILSDY